MSYISKYTKLGMLSKWYTFDDKFIYKTKDKQKIISFENIDLPQFKEINYSYIAEKPKDIKNWYDLTEVISKFDSNYFENLRSINKDLYQVVKKFDKKIQVTAYPKSIEEVINLIDLWIEQSGQKYGFNLHAGYDKTFFKKYFEKYKDELLTRFYYLNNQLVGYSICEKEPVNNTFNYIIRKVDIKAGRSICEYVDFTTFRELYDLGYKEFLINWGCSSGGVLKYKSKNFPIYSLTPYYFWKVKNEI